jgi:hypothetical protein
LHDRAQHGKWVGNKSSADNQGGQVGRRIRGHHDRQGRGERFAENYESLQVRSELSNESAELGIAQKLVSGISSDSDGDSLRQGGDKIIEQVSGAIHPWKKD